MTLKKSNDLAALYLPFAHACAAKLSARYPQFDADDLVSDAMLCVVRASREFNPAAGVSFATYARAFIWSHMRNKFRKRVLPTISIDAPASNDAGTTIGDTLIAGGQSPHEEADRREQVEVAASRVVVSVPADAKAKSREHNRLARKLNISRAEASRRMRRVRTIDSNLGATHEKVPSRRTRRPRFPGIVRNAGANH